MTDRIVALIDMDCFYCQVEARLNPELKGKPSAVVQYNDYKGGGIIAVNYEARAFGVTRNMRGDDAKSKCADIILVKVPTTRGKADLTKYRNAGKEVIQVFMKFGAIIERASIDEAYIDLTNLVNERMKSQKDIRESDIPNTYVVGVEKNADWIKDIQDENDLKFDDIRLAFGAKIVEEMRAEVFKQTEFRCSAGIAHNKVLAKLTAGIHKPNKQTILPQSQVSTLFEKMDVGKVRGLGGKLGDLVCETFHIQTMGELSQIPLLDIRQNFEEKTTNWLFNLAKGIDHEEVKERDLPKSIGCGKNFRGPETLDTRAKVESWMSNLCEELSERLFKDQEENDRTAKTLSVSLSLEKGSGSRQGALYSYDGGFSHLSRSGPLFSYVKESITKQALALIAKTNDLPVSDPNWRPKIRNITLAAFKFIETSQNNQSIQTFFKAKSLETKECLSNVESSKIETHTQIDDNEKIEPLIEEPIQEIQEELVSCEKCGKSVSPFELPEHLDYHLAKELQAELQRELQSRENNQRPITVSQQGNGKRKQSEKSIKPTDSKKQKTIASFFTKK